MSLIQSSVFVVLLVFSPCWAQADEGKELKTLMAQYWDQVMRTSPTWATDIGDHRFNDQLANYTVEDYTKYQKGIEKFKADLKKIDKEDLSSADQVNYDAFSEQLDIDSESFGLKTYYLPITGLSGIHLDLADLPTRIPLDNKKDFQNYLARLNQAERVLMENIAIMKAGMNQGYVQPKTVVKGIPDQIKDLIKKDPKQTVFFEPFKKMAATISESDQKELKLQAEAVIRDRIMPAYKLYNDFLVKEYIPRSRDKISIYEVPNGKAIYQYYIRYHTTTNLQPQQIHDLGLKEVARIRQEMVQTMKKAGFKGTHAAFLSYLRTSPKFYAKSKAELLGNVSTILKTLDGKLPAFFKTLPRMPYGIEPMPSFKEKTAPAAYYYSPTGDGTKAGIFYLNTYDLKARPLYDMESLAAHEAVPGHHLQIALQYELNSLPKFRQYINSTAFVEGWALYAETLAGEMGLYTDPYSYFGKLSNEMLRAARLVVDTGMHSLGWSRKQAMDFFKENTALSARDIESEIDRYIGWPGQALAYKLGELKILEVRKKAQQALGSRFNIRDFHDAILLQGALSLGLLEKMADQYVEKAKKK